MNPRVSVVMAVRNGGVYLREAIESILSQTFKDFEFVIVDDASTDDTVATVSSFADPRIRLIREESNIGQTAALNHGVRASRGEYIARLDADDVALPERLAAQVDFLDRHPDIVVVGTWQLIMNADGKVWSRRTFPTDPADIHARLVTSSPLNWYTLSHPTAMIRRSAFYKVGLFNETYRISQDLDLWVRISREYKLANVPVWGVKYRFHSGSLSQRSLEKTKAEISSITLDNIRYCLPKASAEECDALLKMLLFDPQEPGSKVNVLKVFDDFYTRFVSPLDEKGRQRANGFSQQLKAWYAPQLLKTAPALAVVTFIRSLLNCPSAVFSKRMVACMVYSVKNKW